MNSWRRRHTAALATLLAAVVSACDTAEPAGPRVTLAGCARADEAPFRESDGSYACRRVGAEAPSGACGWPEVTGAAAPVVYARPGAIGGMGTREAPFADLPSALAATPRPATVALGCGTFRLDATLELTRAVALLGAGVGRTVLAGPEGRSALRVSAEAGAAVAVSLRGVTLRPAATAVDGTGALVVAGSGATLLARDVEVDGGADGVRVERGAALCAEALTVRRTRRRGVVLLAGGQGFLRSVLVRGAGDVGVLADRSHVDAVGSDIEGSGRDGLALLGARAGEACAADAVCAAAAPCPGFTPARSCVSSVAAPGAPAERRCRDVSVLVDVVLRDNHITGARAERSPPTAAEVAAGGRDAALAQPGPVVRATRLVVAGTRALPGLPGGDGLYVGPGARVALDSDLAGDTNRGRGSAIVGNARTGILVDGDRRAAVPEGLRQAGELTVAGALVASNAGPGLFVQQRARCERLAFSVLDDNGALGVGVTSDGVLPLFLCNQFIHTRVGTITPEEPGAGGFSVGDGLSIAESGGERVTMVENEFSDNQRFGVVLSGAEVTLTGANRGAGNGFGFGGYGGARVTGDASAIRGLAPPPSVAATTRGSLATTTAP